jgi:16S rRNA (guanine(1405)-N(7))-methyltransferase
MAEPAGAHDIVSIVEAVAASSKYKTVARDLIQSIARVEAPKERSESAAVKRVKRRLHQMIGAYIDSRPRYDMWLNEIKRCAGTPELAPALTKIQRWHASSRERQPFAAQFYAQVFAGLPPPRTVLDLACGLGPLSRPAMTIPENAKLMVYDVLSDLVAFNIEAVKAVGFEIEGGVCNLLSGLPHVDADVVLLLKTIPCLMQADAAIVYPLLSSITAPTIVVSFPTKSLGGSEKGMAAFYEQRFRSAVAGLHRRVETLEIGNELVFRLHRQS